MKKLTFVAYLLVAIISSAGYLYAGNPHIISGDLYNSDDTVPADGEIHFTAIIQVRPGDTLNETINGCGYEGGSWWVEAGNFATSWTVGEVLVMNFLNTTTSATGTLTYSITNTDPDPAPDCYLSDPPTPTPTPTHTPWTTPTQTNYWETVWGYITGFDTLSDGDQIAAFRADDTIVGLATISYDDILGFGYNMVVYSDNISAYEVRFTVWDGSDEIPATPNFTTNPAFPGSGPTQHDLEKLTSATTTPTATIPSVDTPTPTPTDTTPIVDTPTSTPTATSPIVNTPTPTPTATTGAVQIPTSTPTETSPAVDTPTPTPTPIPPLALQVNSKLLKTGDLLTVRLSLTQNISEPFDLYILAEASYGITYSLSLSGNISQGIKAAALNVPSATAPLSATILNGLPISSGLAGTFKFYVVVVQANTIPPVSSPVELTPQTVHVIMLDTVTVTVQ
ncbi:MAG: hypothetical protein NTZ78_13465 [Candidatus Aureabacteria bacterium]|nr:hypothetical protein [Candidatus Auribacterota bacterium]